MTVTAATQAQPDPTCQDLPAAGAAGWQHLADRLHAAAEPTRLRLLAVLRAMPDQQACVSDLTTAAQLPQPMVSHHLQVLYRAALITRTKHGSRSYYQLNEHELQALAQELAGRPGTPAESVCGRT